MKPYELVCVIDAGVSTKEIDDVKKFLSDKLADGLVELDDMWYLPLAYPLNGQDQAYYLSYHIKLESDVLTEFKEELRLNKKIAKYFVYKMKDNEQFVKYSEIQKAIQDVEKRNEVEQKVEEEEEEVEVSEETEE